MNTRITGLLLLGVLAATPALGGGRDNIPAAPRTADAQRQAATLLRNESVASPAAAHERAHANGRSHGIHRADAQNQAADLLRGGPAGTRPNAVAAVDASHWEPAAIGRGAASPDVQAQAQSLLRAQVPGSDKALKVHVVAVSH